jgi:nucleotide-binding universal stress UspA family protein
MAAVDVYENPESGSLSSRIMEIGASLARMEESEFHVVHAWELFGERTLTGRGGLSRDDVERLAGKVRAEHLDRIAWLVNKYALEISPERIHFLKGDAASIILQVAKREKIELIVIGTVGRTGLTGFLIGNTAETVLQQVDSSVLAVKPEGFVSPVKL